MGELSHAARVLKSAGLAPGTDDTLRELRHPRLRPQQAAEPLPEYLFEMRGVDQVGLDKQQFAEALRLSRKGKSAGRSGQRN
eukprot:2841670-Karenia_brevis.AAC.1